MFHYKVMDQSKSQINFNYLNLSNVWEGRNESGQFFSIGSLGISEVCFKSFSMKFVHFILAQSGTSIEFRPLSFYLPLSSPE